VNNVLVVDARLKASLAVIRSLGKKNINITAGSEIKSAIGLYSKYCSKKHLYPNPRMYPQAFIEDLLRMVKNKTYDCIISTDTYTTFLLAQHKSLFQGYTKIMPPDFQVFINAFDKKLLLKTAIKNDVNCPATYFADDIDEIISSIQHYPVVIKPARRHGVKIAICHTPSELHVTQKEMSKKYGPCLLQEYIPNGGEFGVYTLFDTDSEPLALTVQKRIRSLNSYGGISTLRKTVKNDKLVDIAFHLLKTIHWSGVAMVEFRIDERDGTPKLMEINPRFWGSLQLSILSGVDFPYLFYKLIMDEKQTSTLNFKEGIQCRWFFGDITRLIRCPDKLKTILDLLQPTINDDVISIKDPKPTIASVFSPWSLSDDEPRNDTIVISDKIEPIGHLIPDGEGYENSAYIP
jgi:predicted ATP-grasp superfamily ATP-dependent carboligase